MFCCLRPPSRVHPGSPLYFLSALFSERRQIGWGRTLPKLGGVNSIKIYFLFCLSILVGIRRNVPTNSISSAISTVLVVILICCPFCMCYFYINRSRRLISAIAFSDRLESFFPFGTKNRSTAQFTKFHFDQQKKPTEVQ